MSKPLRLLIIEDEPKSAEMVLSLLRRGGYKPDMERVETAAALEAALNSASWDVAICDYHLPSFDAPEALKILRTRAPDLPCIVISGTVGEETAVDLLKQGACDFVAKDKPSRLAPAIERELREAEGRRKRRESENALLREVRRRSEEWERTFDSISDLISIHDRDFRIVRVNKAFTRIFQTDPKTFVGRFCFEVIHKTREPCGLCPMRETLASKKTVVREIFEPGLGLFLEITASPILDDGGEVTGIVHVAKDITSRKQAENDLKLRNVLLSTQQEVSLDAILVVDENGRIVLYNRRFVEIMDIPPELLEHKTHEPSLQFIANKMANPQQFLQRIQYLYEHKKETSRDEIILKDGRILDRYSGPMFGDDGTYYGRVWYFRDITAGKRAVQEVMKLAAIVQSSDDAITSKSLDGIITSWNKGAERIYGYTESEAIGKPISILVPPGHEDEVSRILEKIKSGQHIEHYETVRRRKTGRDIHISLSISPIYDTDGKIVAVSTIGRDITERKRVEKELKESRQQLLDIIDFLPDATLIIDQNGIVVAWNRAIEALTGVKAKEMLGRGNYEHALPFYGERRPILVDLALQAGSESEKLYANIKKEGDVLFGEAFIPQLHSGDCYLSASASVLRNCKGDVIAAIECIRDNTELKRAETMRLKSLHRQERLNRLQQALLAPSELTMKLKTITDGVVDIFGADFCRIWCIRPGDLCDNGCIHASVTEGPHVCQHRDKCLHLLASSGRYTHTDGATHRRVPFGIYKIGRLASGQEHEFMTNDVVHEPNVHDHDWAGELGLASFAGYQLRPPGGETIGVLALFSKQAISLEEDAQLDALSSTTAQTIRVTQADESLRENEQRLKTLIDSYPMGVVVIDADSQQVVDANPAALELMGASPSDLLGRDCHLNISTCPSEKGKCPILDMGQKIDKSEGILIKANGQRISILKSVVAVTLNGRRCLVESFVDISERKMLDAQMLQHEKLESIGQLAAGIAHEINTPIQYIGDHARFLKEGLQDMEPLLRKYDELILAARAGKMPETLPDEIAALQKKADLEYFRKQAPKAIDQALEGVNRVATIVRAMKDFSHPGPAEMTPTDINRAIESTVTVCRNEWKYVADLRMDLDEGLPSVTCIPGEINQVILNMVVNAAHAIGDVVGPAGEKGKGRITVTTRQDKSWAEILISDTGTGIPKHVQSRIFDPFFTTKEVGKGTGQGLTIAYNVITKKHGGSLTFETEPGKGTTFVIRLPTETKE